MFVGKGMLSGVLREEESSKGRAWREKTGGERMDQSDAEGVQWMALFEPESVVRVTRMAVFVSCLHSVQPRGEG